MKEDDTQKEALKNWLYDAAFLPWKTMPVSPFPGECEGQKEAGSVFLCSSSYRVQMKVPSLWA